MKLLWVTMQAAKGWCKLKKILCWSMLLTSIVMFARASEVTENCPLIEDIEMPEGPKLWDSDGS